MATLISNPTELAFAQWMAAEEQARERAVVLARAYHDGEQAVYLTERMKKVLGSDAKFNLNLARTVVMAVAEILGVTAFAHPDSEQVQFAARVWSASRMDERHTDVHEGALRDGEYFVLVDWDTDKRLPRLTPQQRYTDASVTIAGNLAQTGDGFGMRAFYPDGDDNLPMQYAVKRWVEYRDGKAYQRATKYYPDHVEKYIANGGGWELTLDEGDQVREDGFIPWVDQAGKPIGVPVIHFKNPGMRCEAWDAIPLQQVVNKALIDTLMAADMTAFRIFVALGFIPTSDGLEQRKNIKGVIENALDIEPGQIVGTTKSVGTADFRAIEPASLDALLALIERATIWTAMVTGTPVSRFQLTRQVSAVEAQKEGKEPLIAKARNRQTRFGNSWADCMAMARRLNNVYGDQMLDEATPIVPQWQSLETRNIDNLTAEWKAKRDAGVPREQIWREMGYSPEQIAAMKEMPEYKAMLAMMETGLSMQG